MTQVTIVVVACAVLLSLFFLFSVFLVPKNYVKVDFSFENKWGKYDATAKWCKLCDTFPRATVIVVHGWGAEKGYYDWIINELVVNRYLAVGITCPQGVLDEILEMIKGKSIKEVFSEIPMEQWPDGITSCIDFLAASDKLQWRVDFQNLFVIGHSAGGIGALVAAERDSRIRAVVALGPPTMLEQYLQEVEGVLLEDILIPTPMVLQVPVQLQVGTGETLYPYVKEYSKVLDAPRVDYVEIEGADHMQFMDKDMVGFVHALQKIGIFPMQFFADETSTVSTDEAHTRIAEAFLRFLG